VTADVLRQRVDHETRVHRLRPEQRGRRHRVVDDVQDAARLRELADPREVGDLRRGFAIVSTKMSRSTA
jgi:hypothetical protein